MKNINNIPTPEQELILAHILKKSREYVLTHPEITLNKAQKAKFEKFLNRRKNHEPLSYILGHKEFYGLNFKVSRHTLIPRPETEHLVEEVLKLNPKNKNIIDVGTGSGNIIIALAKNIKEKNNFWAIDISSKALRVAKYNAAVNKVDKIIKFKKGDLLFPFIQNSKLKIQNFIFIANLPYLSEKIYNSTSPDVNNFEPRMALLSGKDGLGHYKKLLSQIKTLKGKNPMLHASCFMEIGQEQKNKSEKMIKKYFPNAKITFIKDLAGKWRMAKVEL